MSLSSGLPEHVGDGEDVARFLTSSGHYNPTAVKLAAFMPNPRNGETSVFRHGAETLEALKGIAQAEVGAAGSPGQRTAAATCGHHRLEVVDRGSGVRESRAEGIGGVDCPKGRFSSPVFGLTDAPDNEAQERGRLAGPLNELCPSSSPVRRHRLAPAPQPTKIRATWQTTGSPQ